MDPPVGSLVPVGKNRRSMELLHILIYIRAYSFLPNRGPFTDL